MSAERSGTSKPYHLSDSSALDVVQADPVLRELLGACSSARSAMGHLQNSVGIPGTRMPIALIVLSRMIDAFRRRIGRPACEPLKCIWPVEQVMTPEQIEVHRMTWGDASFDAEAFQPDEVTTQIPRDDFGEVAKLTAVVARLTADQLKLERQLAAVSAERDRLTNVLTVSTDMEATLDQLRDPDRQRRITEVGGPIDDLDHYTRDQLAIAMDDALRRVSDIAAKLTKLSGSRPDRDERDVAGTARESGSR